MKAISFSISWILLRYNSSLNKISLMVLYINLIESYFVLSQGEFGLEAPFNPNIQVKKRLDYDKVKQVTMTLYVQVRSLSKKISEEDLMGKIMSSTHHTSFQTCFVYFTSCNTKLKEIYFQCYTFTCNKM